MARLSEAAKRRIVEHLACYLSPSEVVDRIAEEFGVHMTPRHVRAYDPTSRQFLGGQRWRDYHALVRRRCEAEIAGIAIASHSYRMHQLQRLLDEALSRGSFKQAMEALRLAAKEVSGCK